MTLNEYYVVFPEGGCQEIPGLLSIDALVDINGRPLELPLASSRTIAYRVVKIRRTEERGISAAYHYLELVPALDLIPYTGRRSAY